MTDTLDAIYAEIPAVSGCRRGCSDCCGPVPLGHIEADRVRHIIRPVARHTALPGSQHIGSTPRNTCGGCAYATNNGCSIYHERPFVCRLYAAVDGEPNLKCPHGAKADRPLSRAQAAALGQRYMILIHEGDRP